MTINILKLFLGFFSAAFLTLSSFAAPFAVFNHKTFFIPGQGPVVETYLDFQARSIALRESEPGLVKGVVEITILFRQGEEIIKFGKKTLESPSMPYNDLVDFLDVQRFSLNAGKYVVEITLKDLYASENTTTTFEMDLLVPAPKEGVYFSDIQLVSAFKKTDTPNEFSKSGYDLLPMVSDDFLNAEMQELVAYCEVYGTELMGKDEMFLLSAHLEAATGSAQVIESTRKMERKKTAQVVPYLGKFALGDLGSGDYNLVFEVRNKQNELMSRTAHPLKRIAPAGAATGADVNAEMVAVSWVNRYNNKRELYEHIRSLRPISNDKEIFTAENTLINIDANELSIYQHYFYTFWQGRDANDSEGAWLVYLEKVRFVNEKFATRNKKGYETDRGRVYLRYGAPVDIVDRANEPNSYPYQIWRYYKADKWNNVRFVFYDPRLTRADYDLLHCEYIPGELSNPQWKLMLQQRSTPVIGVDDREGTDHFGGRVDDYFENPR